MAASVPLPSMRPGSTASSIDSRASRIWRRQEDPRRLVARAALEPERVHLVERARFATAVDRDLRDACRAEAAARLALGANAAGLLSGRRYRRLGFVRLADYARERLGISGRSLESAAFVATRLADLPTIVAAFRAGRLSWTQLRLLVGVADAGDQDAWLARARELSIDGLATAVATHRGDSRGAAMDPEADLIDGEPVTVLRVACPSRLRSLWRRACELASRVSGEPLPAWRAAEAIAAEGIAGRPATVSIGDRVLLAFLRLARRRARADDVTRSLDRDVPLPRAASSAPDKECADPHSMEVPQTFDPQPATTDPFELDRRLGQAIVTLRTIEPRIGRLLRVVIDHRLYRALGFRSLDLYVRERLGLSLRKAWALARVERGIRRAAPLADAYERGRLSWARALALLPVVDRSTADAWIERAGAVTVRRLTDEVNWVLDRRDREGADTSLAPPPIDCRLSSPAEPSGAVQIGAHSGAAYDGPSRTARWTGNVTPSTAIEIVDGEVRFLGPMSVVALFRDALDVFAAAGEPRWRALERLLTRVTADWEAEPSHRDPVFARDGWRCTVPACSSRRNLHDHHIRFRSRGGDNRRANRTTVCAAHHLHGIHDGLVRVSGAAPDALRWELPLFSCIGDRYV